MTDKKYDIVIIGSGPAGLTAAIYTSRADLKTVVLTGIQPGGQPTLTNDVENFPGFPEGIKGPDLVKRMMKQAERFGTEFIFETVEEVEFKNRPFKINTNKSEYLAESVIVASGSSAKYLGFPNEKKLIGKGVSTCATCDAVFYKDKVVAVVGGGDVAMEDALTLTKFAKKVYVIHRRDELRASKIMQKRAFKNKKIKFIWNTEVREIVGKANLKGLKIFNNRKMKEKELKVDGLFLAIGHTPNTKFIKDQLELDEKGYIKSEDGIHTNVEGVFVAGDVYDYVYRQAITAAGMGCKAALVSERWLESIKN